MSADGLRVIGLKKTFHKWPFGIISEGDMRAVKGIYFDVAEAELLCILGHNGAGKSTLINMLTGVLGPTSGLAKIANYDVIEEMEEIRLKMGVVHQFDILWDELTAAEHIRMFSKLKGIPDEEIPHVVEERLKAVSLYDCMNAQVKSFSGGMKRRLSVTIGVIGNPSIIFMDEPTTGMDPVSRREAWKLIQQLKKNRTVILTTHSMEEADVLADRVAVIVDGLLKCIGTSLYLKNTYGDGYRLSIVCNPMHTAEVERLIGELVPSSHLIE